MPDENQTVEQQKTDPQQQQFVPNINEEIKSFEGRGTFKEPQGEEGKEKSTRVNIDNFNSVLGDALNIKEKLGLKDIKTEVEEESSTKEKQDVQQDQKAKQAQENLEEKSSDDSKSEEDWKDQKSESETETQKSRQRDLEGFGERESKWLQRMPYEAYEHFSKVIKDSRQREESFKQEKAALETKVKTLEEGRQVLPDSYYENPNAVVLSEDYQRIQGSISLLGDIENYYKDQLRRIENGEEWRDLSQDGKGGVVIDSNNQEPTPEAKNHVFLQIQQAMMQRNNLQGQITGIVNNFKSKSDEFVSKVRGFEKEIMPYFEDEKGKEYGVYQQVSESLAKKGMTKSNPLFNSLAKSVALNLILKDLYTEAVKNPQKATVEDKKQKISEDQKRSGPTESSFSGGNTNTGHKAPTLDDFTKRGLQRF